MAGCGGDGCCSVAPPRNEMEKQALIVGGIVNLLFPMGIGTMVCSCMCGRKGMMGLGCLQLLTAFLVVGAVWTVIYGVIMVVVALGPKAEEPQEAANNTAPQANLETTENRPV